MSINTGFHTFARTATPGTGLTTASGTTTASGSTFSVFVGWFKSAGAAAAPSSVTDSKGNTYTQVGSSLAFGTNANFLGALFECVNGTGGATHTFTANFGASQDGISVWVVEVTGGLTAGIRDQAPAGNDDTASPYTSTLTGTTAQANELLLSYALTASVSGTEAFTWGNSFTALDSVTNANTDATGSSASRVVAATGAYQSSLTTSGAGTTEAIVFLVSYKDLIAGGSIVFARVRRILDESVDERAQRRTGFIPPSAAVVNNPGTRFAPRLPEDNTDAFDRVQFRRYAAIPSGAAVVAPILFARRPLEETPIPDEMPQRADFRGSSVDPPFLSTWLLGEDLAPEERVSRTLLVPQGSAPAAPPLLFTRDRVADEQATEEPVQRRIGLGSSVDTPRTFRRMQAEDWIPLEERISRRVAQLQSVDVPVLELHRVGDDGLLDDPIRRLRTPPQSVDAPILEAHPKPEEWIDLGSAQRRTGLIPAPVSVVDQPPRRSLPRAFEESPEGSERVPGRGRIPLPSGAVPADPAPLRTARIAVESFADETAPRLNRRMPESVDAPLLRARAAVLDDAIDERVARRALAQPVAGAVSSLPPSRLARASTETSTDDVAPRLNRRLPESVDAPPLRLRAVGQEAMLDEPVARRGFVQPPFVAPGQPPLRIRRGSYEEPTDGERAIRCSFQPPPPPLPGGFPPLFLRRLIEEPQADERLPSLAVFPEGFASIPFTLAPLTHRARTIDATGTNRIAPRIKAF